jgi:hypothetical protein
VESGTAFQFGARFGGAAVSPAVFLLVTQRKSRVPHPLRILQRVGVLVSLFPCFLIEFEFTPPPFAKGAKDGAPKILFARGFAADQVDTAPCALNNPTMPRPEAAHRVKSYSSATGYVYQYYFYEVNKTKRGLADGTEYVYMASVDRKHVFPVKIFVNKAALKSWSARTGREFTGTEEYAAAKMRLFQAFDEVEALSSVKNLDLAVDESNLDNLLEQLDL